MRAGFIPRSSRGVGIVTRAAITMPHLQLPSFQGRLVNKESEYQVLWPSSRRTVKATAAAKRLPDLNDKVVCELWDLIFRGEKIYPQVRDYIKARFPRVKFVGHEEFGNFHGVHEHQITAAIPDKLRAHKADAVIVGIGA